MKAIHLRTEYLHEPLALDIGKPRFYWNCEGGVRQSAYQVMARRAEAVIWDSGKVASASMTHIAYAGPELQSRDHIAWSVRLWDENDVSGPWEETHFEMGLLDALDWHARWISGNHTPRRNTRYPVDCFRKEFRMSRPVQKARLYITACGLYEARLNGTRVGSFRFAPGCTDYRKRLQYQAYDVTDMLTENNALTIQLADGWYRGSIGCFGPTNVFGRQTKLLCQLEVVYADGTREEIISDESFRWSNDGPVRFADLKDGEVYDAAMAPGYSGYARVVKEKLTPVASNNVDVREHESFAAKLIVTTSGKRVLDFGQNIAGYLAFTVQGKRGERLLLRCGEILDENGEFTQANFQRNRLAKEGGKLAEILLITGKEDKIRGELQPTPKQQIEFLLSGGRDTYKTEFAVFGFRYALIETDATFDPADFRAIAVYSDMEQTGEFACSSEKVNRLFENIRWSMKGNFLDVPTDCPTRERLAWTGDAQVFFNTGAYLMDVAALMRKWLGDLRDNQFKTGKISAVAPYQGMSMLYDSTGTSVGWADAAVLVPYRYWKRYGDRQVLREFYPMMRKYAMFMIGKTGHRNRAAAKANPYNKYVYEKGLHLGEWLEPEEFKDTQFGYHALHTEECTAYLHYTMALMTEITQALDNPQDEKLFSEYSEGAKAAYGHLFLRDGVPDTDRQAKLVRPLALGLLDGETRRAVQERLALAVENRDYRVGTGFLSTPFVLSVLTEAGRGDLAYRMLENEQAPGWLYEVNRGATTVWEDWEGKASHNHYSPGAVGEWLFDTVAGIRVVGENHFAMQPIPGDSLTYAEASYHSLYGSVTCHWEKTGAGYALTVELPANTTADIVLPNGETYAGYPGRQQYIW